MFSIASHQSSQQAAARAWSLAFALAVSYFAQPLDDFCAFGDWSFRKLLVKGSRADLLESHGQAPCIFPDAWPPLITVTDCVSSVSSWAKASRMSKALDHIPFFVGCLLNL